jgi:MFS family permease
MVACTLIGRHLKQIGKENAITYGTVAIIIQNLGLAYLDSVQDPDTFLLISFIVQIIGGLGSGTNSVSSLALVVENSTKEDREENIGFIEAFTGLGFLAGPLFGSVMFTIGGYSLPFAGCCILMTVSYPLIAINLSKAKAERLNN